MSIVDELLVLYISIGISDFGCPLLQTQGDMAANAYYEYYYLVLSG